MQHTAKKPQNLFKKRSQTKRKVKKKKQEAKKPRKQKVTKTTKATKAKKPDWKIENHQKNNTTSATNGS